MAARKVFGSERSAARRRLAGWPVLLALLAGVSFLPAQWQIGQRTVAWSDPSRSGRSVPALVWYPADVAGPDAPVAAGTFPVIAAGHGFTMPASTLASLAETLVPAGYIVAAPDTETTFIPFPNHEALARDLAFLAARFGQANTDPGSPFHGHVAEAAAVLGHSMGGGCAFMAVHYQSLYGVTFQALAGLDPATSSTDPDSVAAAAGMTLPTLVLANDHGCTVGQQPSDHYGGSGAPCKAYVEILNSNHCQFTDPGGFCSLGDCSGGGFISASQQQAVVGDLLRPFLAWAVKGDPAGWTAFRDMFDLDPRLADRMVAEGCPPAAVPGDLDHDGVAGPAAVSLLARYLAGESWAGPGVPAEADIVSDGVVNVVDLTWLCHLVNASPATGG